MTGRGGEKVKEVKIAPRGEVVQGWGGEGGAQGREGGAWGREGEARGDTGLWRGKVREEEARRGSKGRYGT